MNPNALLRLAAASALSVPVHAQWSAVPVSVPRVGIGITTTGDFTLFAGGRVGNTTYSTVDIHDETAGAWSTADLSLARVNVAAASVGGYALFAGGAINFSQVTDVIDVFDTSSMTWSTVSLSSPRTSVAAARLGDKVFFAGGGVLSAMSDVVDIYDASVGSPSSPGAWSTTTLSQARAGICAVSVGDKVVFAGGADVGGVPLDTVDIYDDTTGQWSTASLSVARLLGTNAGVAVDGVAYFAGGHFSAQGGSTMSDAVDVYHAATDSWTTTTLSVPRGYVAAESLGNTVLFAGGAETGFVVSDVIDVLHAGTGTWTTATYPTGPKSGLDSVRADGAL